MRVRRIVAALLGILIIIGTVSPSYATNVDVITEVEQEQSRTQDEIEDAQTRISDLEEAKQELERYITSLSKEYTDLADALVGLDDKVVEKEEEIEKTREELEEAKTKEAKQYEDMKMRIRYMYEKSNVELIEMLLLSESFAEFLNRAEHISQISNYDRAMLQEYANTRENIGLKEQQLSDEQEELLELQAKSDEKKEEIIELMGSSTAKINLFIRKIASFEEDIEMYEEMLVNQETLLEQLNSQVFLDNDSNFRKEENQLASAMGILGDLYQVESGIGAYSEADLQLLAAIIEVEAVGESFKGQVAVGTVVLNRMKSPFFPNTITGVIFQKGQFEPVATGRFIPCLQRGATQSCINAAIEAMNGRDEVEGALFFRTLNGTQGIIIGNHVFY